MDGPGTDFDYEAELVIVIGNCVKNISEEEEMSAVFGYTVGNDLSVRDLQTRTHQWLIGKNVDGSAPNGPFLTTADEVDSSGLSIRSFVNGEKRQEAHTSDMIYNCAEIVSYISRMMTLLPGDLIFTGTPSGVIAGYPKEKQQWLARGDVVEVEISGLGRLSNSMV